MNSITALNQSLRDKNFESKMTPPNQSYNLDDFLFSLSNEKKISLFVWFIFYK